MTGLSSFLSCDWGTTSFRLRLVKADDFSILAERVSKDGNSSIFEKWRLSKRPPEERFDFYLCILRNHIEALRDEINYSLNGLPVIISGMASSTIGMVEIPYKNLPFSTDGSDLNTRVIASTPDFPNGILLISGAKTRNDVMRGEETQLIGCLLKENPQEEIFLHPGTHSKHIIIKHGKAVDFKTYMTGELFSILSEKSILAQSIEKSANLQLPEHFENFKRGVNDAARGNILHQLFMIRTNDLFEKNSPDQNYYYLSGLLIGTELQDFPPGFKGNLTLAGEQILTAHYFAALKILGIEGKLNDIVIKNPDEITIKGQFEIYRKLKP
jgi:2-dehydro-3-deoxygalactonokinase